MSYQYVIFDCDGVLVDSELLACSTLSAMLEPYGTVIRPEEIMSGYVGMKDTQVIRLLSEKYQLTLPADFMQQYESTLDERLGHNLSPVPGIKEVIESLSVPNALVSNSNYTRILISVTTAGLIQLFDRSKIFSADHAGVAKPDPGIYLYALAKLGISPADAIVVEDSPTGVSAAHKAGITVAGFLATAHSELQQKELLAAGADYIATDSKDLYNLLSKLGLTRRMS